MKKNPSRTAMHSHKLTPQRREVRGACNYAILFNEHRSLRTIRDSIDDRCKESVYRHSLILII